MSTLATIIYNEFRGVECNDTDIANYDVTKSHLLDTLINRNYLLAMLECVTLLKKSTKPTLFVFFIIICLKHPHFNYVV